MWMSRQCLTHPLACRCGTSETEDLDTGATAASAAAPAAAAACTDAGADDVADID